ncbi:hypothetical protein [Bacillus sp. N1-1]|jgi:hypothetical protein|uniref:hypothetical protein n=1 Tax=Bacillus sp. N1-1 TaxID=2682541 RepID=UPI001317F4D5|nr:hypothetical protein [Bacillus sp. N1-1]QHA91424.1 hypothetical protein GNK04_08325 [Bacillus sp. N1-1]
MIKVDYLLQNEIIRYQEQLRLFRISLVKLPDKMPSEDNVRNLCKEAAWKLAASETLVVKIFKSKKLPYRELSKQFFFNIGILKQHSHYILALFLLKYGDYQCLHTHLTCLV